MGLLQKAVETYDCHSAYVGKVREGHAVLAPVSHIITSAQIEITLDSDGALIEARSVDKSEPKIVIPVTEESAGRTSTPSAHPLCDQLWYVAPYHEEKHRLYVELLSRWAESEYCHPKLEPILNYVKGETILPDLTRLGIVELDKNGIPTKEKDLIRWRVQGLNDGGPAECWMDKTLFQAFTDFYRERKAKSFQALCMISGKELPVATQHPKGIIPVNGNAKLISANDSSGFTYRGRFETDWQASSVSYEASQKAHNALRWLAAEQGARVVFGGRTFLCWNPEGRKVCAVTIPMIPVKLVTTKPSDYRKTLLEALEGYRRELPEKAGVVLAAFDAATTGRLSLTYYNELMGSDFLQRLYDWDRTCWWYHGKYGVQSPLLYQIVNCAFGVQRIEKGNALLKTDDKILRQQMQRLVACRVDKSGVSYDIVKALVQRASAPQAYDPGVWREIVYTACAMLQKYLINKEGVSDMSWELDKPNRSFQFGRLLAVMERVERDFYYETDPKDKNAPRNERQTSAIKSMSRFRQHPLNVYVQVNQHLNEAYIPRLKNPRYRDRYERLRSEIMGIITSVSEEDRLNAPLDDVYLIGYDLQRAAFFRKKEEQDASDENKEEKTDG